MSDPAADSTQTQKSGKAKQSLRWGALFLGELRDGLTMVCRKNDADTPRMVLLGLTQLLPDRSICKVPF